MSANQEHSHYFPPGGRGSEHTVSDLAAIPKREATAILSLIMEHGPRQCGGSLSLGSSNDKQWERGKEERGFTKWNSGAYQMGLEP